MGTGMGWGWGWRWEWGWEQDWERGQGWEWGWAPPSQGSAQPGQGRCSRGAPLASMQLRLRILSALRVFQQLQSWLGLLALLLLLLRP